MPGKRNQHLKPDPLDGEKETPVKKPPTEPMVLSAWARYQGMQCVWMTAGVLTYKLCNRRFDCEHCLLHLALSREDLDRDRYLEVHAAGQTRRGQVQ